MRSSGTRSHHRPALTFVLCATFVAAVPLPAQGGLRPVSLRIKPRVGDTLFTRSEQQMEMTATTRLGSVDTTMTVHTSMLMLSHTIVQESDEDGTTVASVTDSVAVSSTGGRSAKPSEDTRRALQGKRVRMRITPQGTATVLDGPDAPSRDVQALFAQMPATLPARPVAVGETWTQQTAIPSPHSQPPRAPDCSTSPSASTPYRTLAVSRMSPCAAR